MQIRFRDWLILIFFGINLSIILFLSIFSYKKLEASILEKTKDQLLSINILKKRHLEHYLREKRDEMLHFIRYADSSQSHPAGLKEMLFSITEVEGVAIIKKDVQVFSSPVFEKYITAPPQPLQYDSLSVAIFDPPSEMPMLIHFGFFLQNGDIHVFLNKTGLREIVMERAGMGTTGESYLVSHDFKMQTPSRFYPDSIPETILAKTEGVRNALNNETGTAIYNDYRGVKIIGAYRTMEFNNLKMALLTEIDLDEALYGVYQLRKYFVFLAFLLIVISFVLSLLLARLLTRPVSVLRHKSGQLARGVLPVRLHSKSLIREINDINFSINGLINALRHTVRFAREIGRENFAASYTPLSERDELGSAIIEMRNKLITLNQQKQQLEIQRKKDLLFAQERERERIAMDIHDGIGPLLTTTKMKVSSIPLEESVKAELLGLIDNTIREIRSVSRNLMPGVLIDFGPAEAISGMVEEINKKTGFNISFQQDRSATSSKIGKEEGIAIYRIAQEAINNALKHAEATEIRVSLTEFEEYVSLFVKDNGKGFDKNIIHTAEGKGLRNIEERVNILGGDMYIDSGDTGTVIEIEIPLQ